MFPAQRLPLFPVSTETSVLTCRVFIMSVSLWYSLLVLPRELHPFFAVSNELPFTAEALVLPMKTLPPNSVSHLLIHVLAVAKAI